MWQNPYTNRTCYGITNNLEDRQRGYKGSNGFAIVWSYTAKGPTKHINNLEKVLKQKLIDIEKDTGTKVTFDECEWILETVEYASIESLLDKLILDNDWQIEILKRST